MSTGSAQTSAGGVWIFVLRTGEDSILTSLVSGKCYPECSGLETDRLEELDSEELGLQNSEFAVLQAIPLNFGS